MVEKTDEDIKNTKNKEKPLLEESPEKPQKKVTSSLGRKATLIFGSHIMIELIGMVALFVVARLMGPEPIGIVAYASGIVGLFAIGSSLGFKITHRKKISEGKDLGKCVGTMILIEILLTAVWVGAFFLWIGYLKLVLHSSFGSREEETVLYIILVSTIFLHTSEVMRSTYIGKSEMAKASVPQILSKIVTASAKITVAFAGLGVIFLAGSQLLGYGMLFFVLLMLFKGYPIKRPDKEHLSDYFKFTFPIMLMTIIAKFSKNLDKVMIGYFKGIEDVAYYNVSARISNVFGLIAYSISAILLPTISSNYAAGKTSAVAKLVKIAERYIVLMLTPVVAFCLVYAETLVLLLLGDKFSAAIILFQIMVSTAYIRAVSRPYGTQLIGTGFVKLTAINGVIMISLRTFLSLILIPNSLFGIQLFGMGAQGAAIALFFGTVGGTILNRAFAWKTLKNKQNPRILIHFFAGAIMGGTILVIMEHLKFDRLLWMFPLAFFGLGIYLGILMIFREFSKKDFTFLLMCLSPKKMKAYIIEEMKGKE